MAKENGFNDDFIDLLKGNNAEEIKKSAEEIKNKYGKYFDIGKTQVTNTEKGTALNSNDKKSQFADIIKKKLAEYN